MTSTSTSTTWAHDQRGTPETTVPFASSTAGGTPLLGTNCPAVDASTPYAWLIMKTEDGSTVYVPAWK